MNKKSKTHKFDGHWDGQPGDHPLVKAPRVQQVVIDGTEPEKVANETYVYEFTYFSALELSFGFFDGAINAMPKGSYMS